MSKGKTKRSFQVNQPSFGMPVIRKPPPAFFTPQAVAITIAQQKGGAALLADETLRYFQRDYTNRVRAFGRNSLPTSYELMDAYFEHRHDVKGFFLLPERDYIFSFSDFLDYVTDTEVPEIDLKNLPGLEPEVIYNVTSSDAAGELLLETSGTSAYGVRAASLVRRGAYLTVTLALAEQLPEERIAKFTTSFADATFNPRKSRMHAALQGAKPAPLLVPGTDLLTSIALVRFDMKSGQIHSRCLLRDMTETFSVLTDIVNTVGYADVTADSPIFANMVAELDESDAVWEVAKTMTLLPAYLNARIASTSSAEKQTALGLSASTTARVRRDIADMSTKDKILFKIISAIEPSSRRSSVGGRSYSPPAFQVPVTGFWRVYSDQSRTGHDESGNPIVGRTWVRSHLRHKEKDVAPPVKVVYIKASLAEARKRLAKYRTESGVEEGSQSHVQLELPAVNSNFQTVPNQPIVNIEQATSTGAVVYVMRCHAHTDNLYKVGFTDRDPKLRAKELSANTSAPLPFQVLQAWAVTDGHLAEQNAHAELADVRLSVNREFFHIGYRELCERLERVLKAWLL